MSIHLQKEKTLNWLIFLSALFTLIGTGLGASDDVNWLKWLQPIFAKKVIVIDRGIEKLMHRLGISHSSYFNIKYKRSGSLFGSKFQDRHVDSNEYLLHLSAYINLNFKAHQLGDSVSKLGRSSWQEYINSKHDVGFCQKDIILGQFKSRGEYRDYAEEALKTILVRKEEDKELKKFLME